MSRFTTVTFNTGNIAAGGHFDSDQVVSNNFANVGKVKVIPSGSTVGYTLQIFKRTTRLAADLQYATKTNVIGNFYDPTDRTGSEVLEGWVLPYEDLDSTKQIHFRLTNNDAVARSYDITYAYEDPTTSALSGGVPAESVAFAAGAGTLAKAASSAAAIRLHRNGIRQRQGAGKDYTVAGNFKDLTLAIVEMAGDYFEAEYF